MASVKMLLSTAGAFRYLALAALLLLLPTTIQASQGTEEPYTSAIGVPSWSDDLPLQNPPNCETWTPENRLECWLWQLQVEIPDQSFSADWIKISIQDMVCSQFVLQDVKPESPAPHALQLSIAQAKANCRGKYKASGGISGKVQAGVKASSPQQDALQLSFQLLPSTAYSLPRPWTWETTSCQVHLQASQIHFNGSISAKLIQAFSKMIGHYITKALQEQLCPLLTQQLDPLVTDYLHQLDEWMKDYLSDHRFSVTYSVPGTQSARQLPLSSDLAPDTIPDLPRSVFLTNPSNDDDALYSITNPLDWSIVRSSLDVFNRQLANHLQQDWIFSSNATKKYCPGRCQHMFRGISGWFRSLVGSKLTIPLPPALHNITLPPLPLDAVISMGVKEVSIVGLDGLNLLQIFRPENRSLWSQISTYNGVYIEAPMTLDVQMPNAKHSLREAFVLQLNVSHLDTMLETRSGFLGWSDTTLLQVVDAVQRFVEDPTPHNIEPTLGCLIRTVALLEHPQWWTDLAVESIAIVRPDRNSSDESLEDDLDDVINTVLKLLLGEYSQLWEDLIHGLIQGPARRLFNDWLLQQIHHYSSDRTCPPVVPSNNEKPKWLNFTKFFALEQLNDFLNHKSTLHSFGEYVECFGKFLEGYVAAQTAELFQMIPLLGESSNFQSLLEVVRIETKGWDSIDGLQLLNPTGYDALESSFQWGGNTSIPQLKATFQVETGQISGVVNVTLFSGFQANLGTQMKYNLNRLENLTVAHLLEQVQCGLVPIVDLRLLANDTHADFGSLMGLSVDAILNNQSISYSTNHPDGNHSSSQDVTIAATKVLEWAVEFFQSFANQALKLIVSSSTSQCRGIVNDPILPDDGKNEDLKWYNYPAIWLMLMLMVLAQGGVFNVMRGPREDLHQTEADNATPDEERYQQQISMPLLSTSEDDILDPAPLEDDVNDYARQVREMDRSLISDIRISSSFDVGPSTIIFEPGSDAEAPEEDLYLVKPLLVSNGVPVFVRFAIPIAIVGTIVLLFSSNVSVGASVDMSVRFGDKSIHLPGLFQFSLGNTISEFFQAGIYPLLFLVVVFSGVWPYAKLVFMFYTWNARYRDPYHREQRLLTLDALSKFSLVDTYVLVIMLVAFRFHVDLSEELGLDVFVTPEYGFYAFLLATCLSLVIGHVMLYFHRRTEQQHQPPQPLIQDDLVEIISILDHAYDVESNGPQRQLSQFFQVVVLFACLAAIVFLTLGSVQESFVFEFGGLAGMVLGDRKQSSYSILTLGMAIPKSVENSYSLGIVFLQMVYYFYAMVTPLMCLLLQLALLLKPDTLKKQQRLLVAAEIANAWSAVEVFLLSIVAALFQISTFANFIIGDKCNLINEIASKLIDCNIIPTEDGVCFNVEASVDWSSGWYLVVGVLLNSLSASLILRLAHSAVHERAGYHTDLGSLPRRLYRSGWLGKRFFDAGAGVGNTEREEIAQEQVGDQAEDDEANAPDWRFWF